MEPPSGPLTPHNDPMSVTVGAPDDVCGGSGEIKARGVLGSQRRNIAGILATKIFAAHLLGE